MGALRGTDHRYLVLVLCLSLCHGPGRGLPPIVPNSKFGF
jgi:hypothetical protein